MRQGRDPSQRVFRLHQMQRSRERQLIIAGMRFKEEAARLPDLDEDRWVDEEGLVRAIETQDVEGIYECVLGARYCDVPLFERYSVEILRVLGNRMAMPAAILTLRNLTIMLSLVCGLLFEMHLFETMVRELSHLSPLSPQGKVYLETISEVLKHRSCVEVDQLEGLLILMERFIMMEGGEREVEMVNVWCGLATFTSPDLHFQPSSLLQLCRMFWRSESQQVQCKLYEATLSIAQSKVVQEDELLLGLMAVIVRGRGRLPESTKQVWPRVPVVLEYLLKEWDGSWSKPICLQTGEQVSQVSVEDYLLVWEKEVLSEWNKDDCLRLWLLLIERVPTEKLIKCWDGQEWLSQMIETLPDGQPRLIAEWLRVLLALMNRSVQESTAGHLGQLYLAYRLSQMIALVLQSECGQRSPVFELCDSLLELLKERRVVSADKWC